MIHDLVGELPELPDAQLAGRLLDIAARPTRVSSAGFPYLDHEGWEILRDEIPHLFEHGLRVLETLPALEEALDAASIPDETRENARRAFRVIRQVTFTAAITAPPDLWLLRQILGNFAELGLLDRLLDGHALHTGSCRVDGHRLDSHELGIDLRFLLARGFVEQYDESYRIAGHPRVAEALRHIRGLPTGAPAATHLWRTHFSGGSLSESERVALGALGQQVPRRCDQDRTHWVATWEEIEIGYRLLPVVLALRATNQTAGLTPGRTVGRATWTGADPKISEGAERILEAAGWLTRRGAELSVSALGARGFQRAPGPFGIIETYHPYVTRGVELLRQGAGNIHVRRGDNIAASQDANSAAFVRANDSLDRFCADTGFTYSVFIEHAVGRGEATRIRFERSGEATIRYFGADLEDAAIDGAVAEQAEGRLPTNMVFARRTDIGHPEKLIAALREAGVDPVGAVMMVGNGFHEIRNANSERMVDVLSRYEQAGILLLFTEENALSVDDLRATAWNTYHAGFRYAHERSGQSLRPANPRAPSRGGHLLRRAWFECATLAGYVRLDAYSHRSRTVYPYPTEDGHNPAISSTHFCVPTAIARRLGLAD